MLLQTNSYIVPKERRAEHARLLRRFRSILLRLGCDQFEVYEQMGPNWNTAEATGRFVQIMRFRDRKHQRAVHAAEQSDPAAQQLINEFCELINLPYQQQQGLLAIGYYNAVPEASAGKGRPAVEPAAAAPPRQRPTTSAGFGFAGPAAGAAALSAQIPPFGTTEDEQDLAAAADYKAEAAHDEANADGLTDPLGEWTVVESETAPAETVVQAETADPEATELETAEPEVAELDAAALTDVAAEEAPANESSPWTEPTAEVAALEPLADDESVADPPAAEWAGPATVVSEVTAWDGPAADADAEVTASEVAASEAEDAPLEAFAASEPTEPPTAESATEAGLAANDETSDETSWEDLAAQPEDVVPTSVPTTGAPAEADTDVSSDLDFDLDLDAAPQAEAEAPAAELAHVDTIVAPEAAEVAPVAAMSAEGESPAETSTDGSWDELLSELPDDAPALTADGVVEAAEPTEVVAGETTEVAAEPEPAVGQWATEVEGAEGLTESPMLETAEPATVAAAEPQDPFDVDDLLADWGTVPTDESAAPAEPPVVAEVAAEATAEAVSDNPHAVGESIDADLLPGTMAEAAAETDDSAAVAPTPAPVVAPTAEEGLDWDEPVELQALAAADASTLDESASLADEQAAFPDPVAGAFEPTPVGDDAIANDTFGDELLPVAAETPNEDAWSEQPAEIAVTATEQGEPAAIDDLAAFAIGGHEEIEPEAAAPTVAEVALGTDAEVPLAVDAGVTDYAPPEVLDHRMAGEEFTGVETTGDVEAAGDAVGVAATPLADTAEAEAVEPELAEAELAEAEVEADPAAEWSEAAVVAEEDGSARADFEPLPTHLQADDGDLEIVFETGPAFLNGDATKGHALTGGPADEAFELDAVFDEALSDKAR